ncbi:pterin-4a-carbinolamine dehydratase [Mucilaginibacter sp. SG538B]|nr:pterin-4a-carbinolamine dehydratase [Mucilaginibacter sp. SG538B]
MLSGSWFYYKRNVMKSWQEVDNKLHKMFKFKDFSEHFPL